MRSDKLYLVDIVDAADAIAEFIADFGAEEFYRDHKTQSAVLQKLIVIGEAAARLSDEFTAQHADIDWPDIVAFRNILVHAYFSVQLEIVWETATQDVPELQRQVLQILAQEFE
jgi:uncharacterized protein with HEPN domain